MQKLNNIPLKCVILDYDMGNLSSVCRACESVGLLPEITDDKKALTSADIAFLPGVGAFGDAMSHLAERDLISPIKDYVMSGGCLVCVCLGLQLLAEYSEEFGVHEGLGLIPAGVVRFTSEKNNGRPVKVPQVGWNAIDFPTKNAPEVLRGIPDGAYMYFAHSYYLNLAISSEFVMTTSTYMGCAYPSAIHVNNTYAFQFHPEISGETGMKIYQNIKKTAIINKTGR